MRSLTRIEVNSMIAENTINTIIRGEKVILTRQSFIHLMKYFEENKMTFVCNVTFEEHLITLERIDNR